MNIKQRLDTFVDAVLAIIITVMVLELPNIEQSGNGGFWTLAKAVGIYGVSFCFVAGIWYQHAVAFSQVEEVPRRTIVWDLVLVFVISLIPEATRLMTVVESNFTVMAYGVLYLVVSVIQAIINRQLAHERFTDIEDMKKMYRAIYGNHSTQSWLLIVINIVLAYFFPKVSMVFWIVITVMGFFTNDSDEEALSDISSLPAKSQDNYVKLTNKDRRDFSQLMREYGKLMRQDQNDASVKEREAGIRKRLGSYGFSEETLNTWQSRFQSRAGGRRPDSTNPQVAGSAQDGDFRTQNANHHVVRDITREGDREMRENIRDQRDAGQRKQQNKKQDITRDVDDDAPKDQRPN